MEMKPYFRLCIQLHNLRELQHIDDDYLHKPRRGESSHAKEGQWSSRRGKGRNIILNIAISTSFKQSNKSFESSRSCSNMKRSPPIL